MAIIGTRKYPLSERDLYHLYGFRVTRQSAIANVIIALHTALSNPVRPTPCLGLFEDGDVRVGILPQREEVVVSVLGFGSVTREKVCSSQLQVRQGPTGSARTMPR